MKFEIVEIKPGDVVLTILDIGNMTPFEIDKYVDNCMKPLQDAFGCDVMVIPVRGEKTGLPVSTEGWNFIIVRNPNRKSGNNTGTLKKVDTTEES